MTIFPDYLAPLDLSLIGAARRDGLIDLRVRDLRDHAHDRHRTVDDAPYGGGAGMVMRPEPWGEAFDAILGERPVAGPRPRLVVPGPGGVPFTQERARELAAERWLVFACGRYEGIDERVYEHALDAFEGRVEVLSLGDFVVNGGEVAVLAVIEAVARLLPGVVGNAESLVEESHEDGLLEYPVYTRPPSWRGLDVPAVLRSGDHDRIAAWRHEQRLARTAARRPDLLHPSSATAPADLDIGIAAGGDVAELFTLTRACAAGPGHGLAAAQESLDELRASLGQWRTWVARSHGRLVASVRARRAGAPEDLVWQIERLLVAPDLRGRGIARVMLDVAEGAAPAGTQAVRLVTDACAQRALRRSGYRPDRGVTAPSGLVALTKHPAP